MGAWLRDLGLDRYETEFLANRVDADVLPRLTSEDLREIGVIAIGDRRKLLDAIAVLVGEDSAAPRGLSAPLSARPLPGAPAERRPITVMFCDLVGSTGLAARLDVEDWRELVNSYFDEATKAVTDFGGQVQKRLGDGLMALFGYPQAKENDAERGVRAALAIQEGLTILNARKRPPAFPNLSRASASRAARSWSMQRARCSGMRRILRRVCRQPRSPGPC